MRFTSKLGNYETGPRMWGLANGRNFLPWQHVWRHPIKAWRYLHGWREV